jgi:hypothetical protein
MKYMLKKLTLTKKKKNCNIIEKLNIILNPLTPEDIKTVVSFSQQSLELSKGDI